MKVTHTETSNGAVQSAPFGLIGHETSISIEGNVVRLETARLYSTDIENVVRRGVDIYGGRGYAVTEEVAWYLTANRCAALSIAVMAVESGYSSEAGVILNYFAFMLESLPKIWEGRSIPNSSWISDNTLQRLSEMCAEYLRAEEAE